MDMNKLMERMKQQKQALARKGKTIKPKPGKNRFILLPGWRKGEEHVLDHKFGQHFIKNEAGEIQAVYPCLDATYGRPCPLCAALASAARVTTDPVAAKQLEEASCGAKKAKFLMNVIALDHDDPVNPQILELGSQATEQIQDIGISWATTVFDPENPQLIQIERSGTGLNTKYSVQILPDRVKMPSGALTKLHNLDEYVAQENEDNARRAIGAINNVAGILPPEADKPKTPSLDDQQEEDLRSVERAAAKTPAPAPKMSDVAADDDLDDFLKELEAGTGTEG